MRKISRTRFARKEQETPADTRDEHGPRGVRGATITSRHASLEIDTMSLFARHRTGASLAGSASGGVSRDSMALSDGTEIGFAALTDFTKVLSL